MAKFAEEMKKRVSGVTPEAMQALTRHRFPGNVRELENYMERAVALVSNSVIDLAELPAELRTRPAACADDLLAFPDGGVALEETLAAIERRFIDEAMQRTGGIKTKAAELLGLSFRSLRYRLQKLEGGDSELDDDARDVI